MSTQVFLRSALGAACDAWGPGSATWNPNAAFTDQSRSQVQIFPLRLSRGAGSTPYSGTSVGSSTGRLQFGSGGTAPIFFVSPPIDRDVTIASTITFNLWGLESSMQANTCMGCYVARIAPDGTVSASIGDSARTSTELGTSAAVQNWTQDATDLALHRGDRLLIVPYFTNFGTMGGGFTITFDFDGPTAGADGDSYVTFTEDFGFIERDGSQTMVGQTANGTLTFGSSAASSARAFRIYIPYARTLASIGVDLFKNGSPGDNVQVAVQADAAGNPSGSDLTSASIAGTTLTGSVASYTFDVPDQGLSPDTWYWIVLRRSGAVDAANYYNFRATTLGPPPWNPGGMKFLNSGTWTADANDPACVLTFTSQATTLYPTTTAGGVDPNGATYDSYEAWTSRGSGVTTAVTNTAAAPASPLLATVSAGGNYVEWFSRQLTAFTLAGPVLVNMRCAESDALANVTTGCEIAVCAADGTSPTVWGYTLEGNECGTTEAAKQFFVAGDDVAVTDGQRLRVRFYIDDSSAAAMAASYTSTIYYAGAAGATGDLYLTFGQTLNAKTFSLPHERSSRRRLPSTVPVYA